MEPDEFALENALRGGDMSALTTLFERERERILRMVHFRMDPRLVGRIDPEDVVQDTFLEAEKRIEAFQVEDKPFFLWLRLVAQQTMVDLFRKHIGAKMRNAAREVRSPKTHAMSGFFVGHFTSPSQAAIRGEMLDMLREAFDEMDPVDREVLALRHFEELSNNEVAEILGLQKAAASNRYVRALKRLQTVMTKTTSYRESLVDHQ